MMIVKGNITIAHFVKQFSGCLITQQRRIAFYVGVQALFGNEIRGDFFYFFFRTAVKRRKGYARRNNGRNCVQIVFFETFKQINVSRNVIVTAFPGLRVFGVSHPLNVRIDLFRFDSVKAITDAHVKNNIRGVVNIKFFGVYMT